MGSLAQLKRWPGGRRWTVLVVLGRPEASCSGHGKPAHAALVTLRGVHARPERSDGPGGRRDDALNRAAEAACDRPGGWRAAARRAAAATRPGCPSSRSHAGRGSRCPSARRAARLWRSREIVEVEETEEIAGRYKADRAARPPCAPPSPPRRRSPARRPPGRSGGDQGEIGGDRSEVHRAARCELDASSTRARFES